MTEQKSKPNIFEYLDILSYLQDYYFWRKSLANDFSYEAWSDELNFRSRSYVRMVVIGKRNVSTAFVDAFSERALEGQDEKEYLSCLVNYSQASRQEDKKAFSSKMLQILRTKNNQSILDADSELLSTPGLLRLYTVLGFRDVFFSLENLVKIMELSEDHIAGYLSKLEEFNLVEKKKAGESFHWRALHEKFKIPDNKGSMNLMRFHELSLHDAIYAFSKPKHLRKYKSLMIALTEEELGALYGHIEDFSAEQINRYSPAELKDRRLFQLNLNIYPVTAPPEEEMVK